MKRARLCQEFIGCHVENVIKGDLLSELILMRLLNIQDILQLSICNKYMLQSYRNLNIMQYFIYERINGDITSCLKESFSLSRIILDMDQVSRLFNINIPTMPIRNAIYSIFKKINQNKISTTITTKDRFKREDTFDYKILPLQILDESGDLQYGSYVMGSFIPYIMAKYLNHNAESDIFKEIEKKYKNSLHMYYNFIDEHHFHMTINSLITDNQRTTTNNGGLYTILKTIDDIISTGSDIEKLINDDTIDCNRSLFSHIYSISHKVSNIDKQCMVHRLNETLGPNNYKIANYPIKPDEYIISMTSDFFDSFFTFFEYGEGILNFKIKAPLIYWIMLLKNTKIQYYCGDYKIHKITSYNKCEPKSKLKYDGYAKEKVNLSKIMKMDFKHTKIKTDGKITLKI